jgi:hypothetical protein
MGRGEIRLIVVNVPYPHSPIPFDSRSEAKQWTSELRSERFKGYVMSKREMMKTFAFTGPGSRLWKSTRASQFLFELKLQQFAYRMK